MRAEVKERDIMKKWIEKERVRGGKVWVHRIVDSPYGGYKVFDVELVRDGVPWALEFKVHRKKTLPYSFADISSHQIFELKKFKDAGGRSAIVVYDEGLKKFFFWEL